MKRNRTVLLAGIPLAAALLIVLLGLNRLSIPDPNQVSLYLGYTCEETNGWIFETESGPAEPHMGFGGYFQGIAAESDGPVAASRIMEDPGMRNLLEFSYYNAGIQVFLDDKLLYTDFPSAENHADAFLEGVSVDGLGQDTLHISLPYDCAGKTLRIVTYGQLWDGYRSVSFPSLVSRFSDAVVMSADTVWDMAAAVALSLLSLILLLAFLLGVQMKQLQWKFLPLAAYFLLSTVPVIRRSFAATAAGLDGAHPMLDWIALAHMDCLIAFFAMDARGWRRWTLCAGCGLHVALSLVQTLWGTSAFPAGFMQDPAGLMLFVLSVVLMLSSRQARKLYRWIGLCTTASAAIMFAAWGISRFAGLELLYPAANPVTALLMGDFRSFYRIESTVTGAICVFGVIAEFIQSILHRQKQEQALLLCNRMAQESYAHALDSIKRTAHMRHEWKNHITSLCLLQKQGKTEELEKSLQALNRNLEHLVSHHYSEHFTINTILQNAAARAEKLGVKFTAVAPVPHGLSIAESDLCSLLLNMLDNALEAAGACDPDMREIECALHIRQGYLAVKCENSFSGVLKYDDLGRLQTTHPDAEIHGFGLMQMKKIAKKYGSVLDISHTDDRFIVQTALKLI